jgi:hypothetical protein
MTKRVVMRVRTTVLEMRVVKIVLSPMLQPIAIPCL